MFGASAGYSTEGRDFGPITGKEFDQGFVGDGGRLIITKELL